jgi:hypothetical protein
MVAALLVFGVAGTAWAQADDPNPGALTFTGGFDVLPGVPYVFRGIVQETDPEITMWPFGDIGIALFSGDGALKSVSANFGVWNSLHTGPSGLDGPEPSDRLHYEEDFYATLGLAFGSGITVGTTFTAYTSPNGRFATTQELGFRVAKSHFLSPYGLVAFELDGAADGTDSGTGTYLELGVGPSWALGGGRATVTIPVKVGLSLNDYYEGPDGDEPFGFFDIGALFTLPITAIPSSFGSWNVHAGADLLVFGDTTKFFNNGDSTKVVGLFGIGLAY